MISLLHPSRSRPEKARRTRNMWMSYATHPENIEYILSIDTDDTTKEKYRELFHDTQIIINPNRSLIDATNNAAKLATQNLLIVVSDDTEPCSGWDTAIINATEGKQDFALKVFDGIQKWIMTIPIVDRAYYDRVGYIYCPTFKHLFADTHQTHLADMEGKLIIRNDIEFKHLPHYITKTRPDAVSRRSDSTQRHGELMYIDILKTWHRRGYNIFSLSKEAEEAGHVNWLKHKVRV